MRILGKIVGYFFNDSYRGGSVTEEEMLKVVSVSA